MKIKPLFILLILVSASVAFLPQANCSYPKWSVVFTEWKWFPTTPSIGQEVTLKVYFNVLQPSVLVDIVIWDEFTTRNNPKVTERTNMFPWGLGEHSYTLKWKPLMTARHYALESVLRASAQGGGMADQDFSDFRVPLSETIAPFSIQLTEVSSKKFALDEQVYIDVKLTDITVPLNYEPTVEIILYNLDKRAVVFDTIFWRQQIFEPSQTKTYRISNLGKMWFYDMHFRVSAYAIRYEYGVGDGYKPINSVPQYKDITIKYLASSESGGGCPKLYVQNDNKWTDYGIINIHPPEGQEDASVDVAIEYTGITNAITLKLEEPWHEIAEGSFIDYIDLSATDLNGREIQFAIETADHSALGDVKSQLLYSDNVRIQIKPSESITMTFKLSKSTAIRDLALHIEGRNPYGFYLKTDPMVYLALLLFIIVAVLILYRKRR